jgi:rhodanese-related sulfurtransferase
MHFETILPEQIDRRRENGERVELIDVRMPVEYREVHADIARNVPLESLDPDTVMQARNGAAQDPLYVICRSGSRAAKACGRFVAAGHNNVVCVEGGTCAWEEAGLAVVRGKKAVSLERQVRIAAGLLAAVGSGLAFWGHPYFIAIPAAVGMGLIWAGITDQCPMAMGLARMPWNRVSCDPQATCSS